MIHTRTLVRNILLVAVCLPLLAPALQAQSLSYRGGQNISPAYEGWERAADGSLYFLFGYMNRNWEEEIDVPVGPANTFSPGPPDRGQPTHFQPRRNRFTFKVAVPEGFTEQDELVWTLTAHGVTEVAYASLRPDYFVDNVVIMSETGALGAGTSSPEIRANLKPVVQLETPATIEARVGERVRLVARITDDGVPEVRRPDATSRSTTSTSTSTDAEEEEVTPEQRILRRALNPPFRVTVGKTDGLHFGWHVYRGEKAVSFDPIQAKSWEDTRAHGNSPWAPGWIAPPAPADDRWVVDATFTKPGTYLLRGRADDGGLYEDIEVTVNVW